MFNSNRIVFFTFKTGYKFPPVSESSDALFTAETVSVFLIKMMNLRTTILFVM